MKNGVFPMIFFPLSAKETKGANADSCQKDGKRLSEKRNKRVRDKRKQNRFSKL